MFFQANPQNLPEVSFDMVLDFIYRSDTFCSGEFKGRKAARSGRAEYGDKAIGFVEVMREAETCTVRGKITPEHRMRTKPYTVSAVLDEKEGEIKSAECHDCAASQGGCKHAIAFIFWLHHRTIEPAPTSVTSYWKKSALARLGSNTTYTLDEFCGTKKVELPPGEGMFVEELRQMFKRDITDNMLMKSMYADVEGNWRALTLHQLKRRFALNSSGGAGEFLSYCSTAMTEELCREAKAVTVEQRHSAAWFELRYGRVTASTIYNCAQCRTSGGSLVDRILGSGMPFDTSAMKRGRELEPQVLQEVERQVGIPLKKSGLILDREFPFLGASPDGVGVNFCVEIKCPSKRVDTYLQPNGSIKPIYDSQIQLQMYLLKFKTGLFVVADPQFEKNKKINLTWVTYDPLRVTELIQKARLFWEREIFPSL